MALLPPSHLSKKGARFIGAFEGLNFHPYNDAAGNATIGYGHLIHYGPVTLADVKEWEGFDANEAAKLLIKDAEHVAAALRAFKPRIRNQARFDALVSLGFNCGVGVFDYDRSMGKALRAPGRRGAADAFLLYDSAGGKVLAGLQRRREAERKLWRTGLYR